jgi:cbb3-type cytochrome c oxidase subunit II
MKITQELVERKVGLLIVLTFLTVLVGGAIEIIPLFWQQSTTTPIEGLKPYDAVRLVGRDIYLREGCYNCHSQMIRPFRAETERYGHYRLRVSRLTITPSSGVRSAPVQIWHVLGIVTRTRGMLRT